MAAVVETQPGVPVAEAGCKRPREPEPGDVAPYEDFYAPAVVARRRAASLALLLTLQKFRGEHRHNDALRKFASNRALEVAVRRYYGATGAGEFKVIMTVSWNALDIAGQRTGRAVCIITAKCGPNSPRKFKVSTASKAAKINKYEVGTRRIGRHHMLSELWRWSLSLRLAPTFDTPVRCLLDVFTGLSFARFSSLAAFDELMAAYPDSLVSDAPPAKKARLE